MNHDRSENDVVIGVLGGMGPLASAEFIKTIYEFGLNGESEQSSSKILMVSDPSLPDRTAATTDIKLAKTLIERLTDALTYLEDGGAKKVVICCVTAHQFLRYLPDHLQCRCISLVDLMMEELLCRNESHLLLCTQGTRRSGTFEKHPYWKKVEDLVVMPSSVDQREIHQQLYQLKMNRGLPEFDQFVAKMMHRYGVSKFISGCTEVHLYTKYLMSQNRSISCALDPLMTVACSLNFWRQSLQIASNLSQIQDTLANYSTTVRNVQ